MSAVMMGKNSPALSGVTKEPDSGARSLHLFAIAPGASISHGSAELTLVLKGSYADETGHFRPGELGDPGGLDDSVQQQPVADTAKPCIYLIATDDKLKLPDVFDRMLQALVGR